MKSIKDRISERRSSRGDVSFSSRVSSNYFRKNDSLGSAGFKKKKLELNQSL